MVDFLPLSSACRSRREPSPKVARNIPPTTLALLAFIGVTALAAQQPDSALPAQSQPIGYETPAQTVDRFVTAFNAGDTVAVRRVFGPQAKMYGIDLGSGFSEHDWLDHPWQLYGLMTNQLSIDENGWSVIPGTSGSIAVLGRVSTGSFLAQTERWTSVRPDGTYTADDHIMLYETRGGRIHRVWWVSGEHEEAPPVPDPTYAFGRGPFVWVDAWHRNQATPDGTYFVFADLLRKDGYVVRTWEAPFTRSALDSVDVLVIANAMPDTNERIRPGTMPPSAFEIEEMDAVADWVAAGGSLLLIADHSPMAGASAPLAAMFGVEFQNGEVRDTSRAPGGGDYFRRSDGSLAQHAVTDGFSSGARVDSVATFLGQAFPATPDIEPVLVLRESMVLSERLESGGPPRRTAVGGWLQGGVRDFGNGRVALFGEAWMFRFLSVPPNAPPTTQNARFIRNLMRWLTQTPQ